MKTNTVIIFWLVATLVGCSTKNQNEWNTFDDFPVTINLSTQKIHTEPVLYSVGGMVLLDSVLITVDLKADTFFRVFKLPLFEHIGGFVAKGQGPNEETFIDPFIKPIFENKFLFQGLTSMNLAKFNNYTNNLEIVKRIDLPSSLMLLNDAIILGDSVIGNRPAFFEDDANESFIGYHIVDNKFFEFGGKFPFVKKNLDPSFNNDFFGNYLTIKPDGSAFASVYYFFPILRIYNRNGKIINEVRFNNGQRFPYAFIEKEPTMSDRMEVMQNYFSIKSTNNFIYAMYIGKKEGEMEEGWPNNRSNEIHVWDWDGNPIKRILLDKKIFAFDVEKNDKFLIASSLESLDAFFKYDLKENKDNHKNN
jgi:hypothetical protein